MGAQERPWRGARGVAVVASVVALALGTALLTTRLLAPLLLGLGDDGVAEGFSAQVPEAAPRNDAAPGDLDAGDAASAPVDSGPDGAPGSGPSPPGRTRRGRSSSGGSDEGSADGGPDAGPPGYVVLGPHSYLIERAWLERVLAGDAQAGGAQTVPHEVDGRQVGYKLVAVSGALRGLGLREGDVLTEVNGKTLHSPDAALDAYRRNVRGKRLRLTVLRGGARVSLDYRIE